MARARVRAKARPERKLLRATQEGIERCWGRNLLQNLLWQCSSFAWVARIRGP